MKATERRRVAAGVLGRVLLVMGLAVTLAPPLQGVVAEAAEAPRTVTPAAAVAGATGEWWAEVQAQIQLEMDPAWTGTGEHDGDYFGGSVASAGDVNGDGYADVIVGAFGYASGAGPGRAYAYYGSASGLPTSPSWDASGGSDDDRFGVSVAGAGDVNGDGYADVIVGAEDSNGSNVGQVFVFAGSESGISTSPVLTLTAESEGDGFGTVVAGAGDVNGDGYADVLIGAPGYDSDVGRAYAHYGSASGLGTTPRWTADGATTLERFGISVAGAGDVNGDGFSDVIVGASGWKGGIGKTYIYFGNERGLKLSSDWSANGENSLDYFGFSVDGAGDVNGDGYADVIVGAYGYDGDRGKAYVYHGRAVLPDETVDWTVTGESQDDRFGRALAGAGDVNGDGYADVIIGAPQHSGGSLRGWLSVYVGGAGGLSANEDWYARGESNGDYFGYPVAGAGDVNGDGFADLIASAALYNAGTFRGQAYVYHGAALEPSLDTGWSPGGDATADQFGYSVAGAGDVNADGYGDVIVGAPGHGGSNDYGKAYLFLGSASGLEHLASWDDTGEGVGNRFGNSVAGAGDVNGDGYGDVIVGAEGYAAGSSQGKVYLYYGSTSGLSSKPDWTALGENLIDYFGASVAGTGDVNGDGYADIVVGAPKYPNNAGKGKIYVYHGSHYGPGSSPDWFRTGEATSASHFGASVAGAGDVNGDGYGDVIAGAWGYVSESYDEAGRAYLIMGSATGLSAGPIVVATGTGTDEHLGKSVAGAGDVNGDGYADLIVGAPGYNSAQGQVQIVYGDPSGVNTSLVWTFSGEYAGDAFGSSVGGAGDVNGDGYADVIVGAPGHAGGGGEGVVDLFYGGAAGPGTDNAWGYSGDPTERVGASVAGAGDVDGDGFADLLTGAPGYSSDTGRAHLALGNGGGGRLVLAHQRRSDGSRVWVQPWGLSHRPDSFEVLWRGTDPMGRGRIAFQVQACPPGVPFGHATCTDVVDDTWRDVGTTNVGIPLREILSGLEADTLYRWRVRVLHAPFSVTEPHIIPPPNPAHGPWRRLQGQAVEADIRVAEAHFEIYLPLVVRGAGP
ncbi:MAG: FG-GAP-like repeat-containing protein [Anaerolineae bacterium]|jgi:hypothetical protein